MTQIFAKNGKWVPVTIVKAGPCFVIQKKNREKEGYAAVQLGFKEIEEKKVPKAYAGHFKQKQSKVYRFLQELKTDHVDSYNPGDKLTIEYFQDGDVVDICGRSKGKGFQGVMKRHNFAGGRASHGTSVSHRAPGSIGQRTWPGKVFKGKRMAGHMGDEVVTVKNLTIVGVEPEQNLLLIKGAVPGANHSLVVIYATTGEFEKRRLSQKGKETKEEAKEASKA